MPEPVVYPAAVVRLEPDAIPVIRRALDDILEELSPLLHRMEYDARIPEPAMGDSVSHRMWTAYNTKVMEAEDGPYRAMLAYEQQLVTARDRLAEAEERYRQAEAANVALAGRL